MPVEQLEKPKTYYELLEVTQGSSDDDIKRAYRRLALKFHPDRPGLLNRRSAELRFRQINEAYAHLKTPEKRAIYDNVLRAQNDNARKNFSFWDTIAEIFQAPQGKTSK